MGSRRYTSDLAVVTTDILVLVPSWHQSLYVGVQEIGIKWPYPGGDSLLHLGISFKPLANQVALKRSKEVENTGREIKIVGRVVLNHSAVAP
jgi:hypothetical protein